MADLWSLERRLWTEGVDAYERLLATACTMVFCPTGIMHRDAIIESMKLAPRWSDVGFSSETETAHGQGVTVLAYRAAARRDGGQPYEALCTSTYIFQGGEWRIVQHQQTPV